MSSNSKKKHKKAKRAEKKRRERAHEGRYPVVRYDETHGHPQFVEAVKAAVAKTDFDDPCMFGKHERAFHRVLRHKGKTAAFDYLRQEVAKLSLAGDPMARVLSHTTLLCYGTQMFQQIPMETRKRFLPFHDVRADFEGRDIVLRFSSMCRKSGNGGTTFYSRREPKIRLLNREWKVAFSRHAIEQICTRFNPRYLSYAAAGDVHAFFSTCLWFEPVTLFGNQPAFSMWDTCGDAVNLRHGVYVQQILGEENVVPGHGRCYHRVGYCPVVFEDGFAKAKTFLCPGYDTTPEFGLVIESTLPELEKDLLLHYASSSDVTHVAEEGIEAVKWFHENGVPQVKQMRHVVFDE